MISAVTRPMGEAKREGKSLHRSRSGCVGCNGDRWAGRLGGGELDYGGAAVSDDWDGRPTLGDYVLATR